MRNLRLAHSKTHITNRWFSMSNSKKIMIKMLTKACLFSLAFFTRFWEDFGRVLGGVLEVFWDYFVSLGGTFANLLEHF